MAPETETLSASAPDGGGRAPSSPQRRGPTPLDPVREAEAAAALKASLGALAADDPTLALDMIEGETGLLECIDALLARMSETRAFIEGLDVVIADLRARKDRFEKRIETDRALIEQAMMIADLPKLERPAATLSLATRQPRLEIDEESAIPSEFWVAADPKLDRKALAAALKDRPVPGAHLSNAAPTLTVRVK